MRQIQSGRRYSAALLIALAGYAGGAALAAEHDDIRQLLDSGQHAQALSKTQSALAAKPKDPQLQFLRGVILTEMGRRTEAITVFRQLVTEHPELPEPYNNLAVLYAGNGDFDKARDSLTQAINTNPSYAIAHENLGDLYATLASKAYSKALQLDANNNAVKPKLAVIRQLSAGGASLAVAAAPQAQPGSQTLAQATPRPAPEPAQPPVPSRPSAAPAPTPVPPPSPSQPSAPAATPVPATPATATPTAPATAAATSEDNAQIEAALKAWTNAWSSRDVAGYLAAYSPAFETPRKISRKAWEEERRVRIDGKARITVQLSDVKVAVDGNTATAKFRQSYKSDALDSNTRKTLALQKSGNRWLIVKESTGS